MARHVYQPNDLVWVYENSYEEWRESTVSSVAKDGSAFVAGAWRLDSELRPRTAAPLPKPLVALMDAMLARQHVPTNYQTSIASHVYSVVSNATDVLKRVACPPKVAAEYAERDRRPGSLSIEKRLIDAAWHIALILDGLAQLDKEKTA